MRSVIFFCSRILFLGLGAILCFSFTALAQRSPSDINGDKFSDFVLINIDRSNNSLEWEAHLSKAKSILSLRSFGVAGNHIAMTDWLGVGTPQLGFTELQSNGNIVWKILNPDGVVLNKQFGKAGDIVVSGADFNNNGFADAAIIRSQNEQITWRIWYDMFSPQAPNKPSDVVFGTKGDKFFFTSPYGAGDWLGVLRKKDHRLASIILKNPLTNEEQSFSASKTFVTAKLSPLPVKQANGSDVIVQPVRKNKRTIFYIKKLDKKKSVFRAIPARGEMIVGNFNGRASEEIAIQTSRGFLIFNPLTLRTRRIKSPKGIPVDEININKMGTLPDNPTDNPTNPTIPGSGDFADVCAQYSPAVFPEIFMKSAASGHLGDKDPRSSGYTVLCGTQCPKNLSKADLFYANGAYAASIGKYSVWSSSGKPRMYGGTASAPPHSSAEIGRIAAQISNGKIYLQISSARNGPNTYCKEFSAIGRSGGIRTSYGSVQ